MKMLRIISVICLIGALTGCASGASAAEEEEMKFTVTANGTEFSVIPEKNAAVSELQSRLKDGDLKLTLQDYSGFEKVGALGFSLPRSNVQMTTKAGDIVLYNGNQIVVFYGSNSWSYTKLGKVEDLTGWEEALGSGDVELVFSLQEADHE